MGRMMQARKVVVVGLLAVHVAAYAALSMLGLHNPLDPFSILLLAANVVATSVLARGSRDLVIGAGFMILVAAHDFLGRRLAPDELTSGAILLTSILTLYVGVRVNRLLPPVYWLVFVATYLLLYVTFVVLMDNAEPLFILFLLGLVACARSLRLMAYFWAFTVSFTFCQPYAWEVTLMLFITLMAVFGAHGKIRSTTAVVFLLAGLIVMFLVLLPVTITVLGVDLHNMETILRDPRIRSAIWTTFYTATLSTGILLVFGVPFAYALSRLRFPGRPLVLSLIDLPIVIPQSVAGIALLYVFGRKQAIGGLIFDLTGFYVDGTVLGICVAQVFVAMPFLVRTAVAAFDAVDEEMEMAARTLGASSFGVFRRIACPLAARGIFLGGVLAWARAAGEFGAVFFIAQDPVTAPVAAYKLNDSKGVSEAAPLVASLILFSVAMFFLLQLVSRTLPAPHGSRR